MKKMLIEKHHFFENAPWLPNAKEFLLHLKSISLKHKICLSFLTAAGDYSYETAKKQKIKWRDKYCPDMEINIVKKSFEKANFASKNSILIDDRKVSTEPFIEKNGHAILHYNHENTIMDLNRILTKNKNYFL